jgi:hypothetical protein
MLTGTGFFFFYLTGPNYHSLDPGSAFRTLSLSGCRAFHSVDCRRLVRLKYPIRQCFNSLSCLWFPGRVVVPRLSCARSELVSFAPTRPRCLQPSWQPSLTCVYAHTCKETPNCNQSRASPAKGCRRSKWMQRAPHTNEPRIKNMVPTAMAHHTGRQNSWLAHDTRCLMACSIPQKCGIGVWEGWSICACFDTTW